LGGDNHYRIYCVFTNGTSAWVTTATQNPNSTNYNPETAMATGKVSAQTQQGEAHVAGTNVYYRSQLQKIGVSNGVVTATNAQHRIYYYGKPTHPGLGESNYFNAQGLGLVESNWSFIGSNDWSSAPANSAWTVGTMATAPSNAPSTGTNAISLDIYSGFKLDPAIIPVLDWQFQYCTNKFW
jgi:hypothetical protein